jgi:transposase
LEKAIRENISPDKRYVIGFLDESSPQTAPNTPRLWSFAKKPKIFKNTQRMKANANAFYALNGNSVIDFKESSKAKDVSEFLERIKGENDCGIIVTLDNSKTHHADITVKKAKQLDMIFVFLPAYSPDLNPLEYIWKSIRKDISKEIIESVTRLRELIRNKYTELAPSKSFAKNWMKTFGEIIKSVTNC